MLLKQCRKCGVLIPYGQSYCEPCKRAVEANRAVRIEKSKREADKRYNAKRDPKEAAFYRGRAWRMLSAKRIQADGYKCKLCGSWATEVDHIIPIQTPEGWERRYEWDNLQSLCTQCHNKKHKRFGKYNGRPQSPRDNDEEKSIIPIFT